MSNKTAEEVKTIINKSLPSSQSNIFQLRKDFEQLYLKFSSKQELNVESQNIGDIPAFKICAENAQNDYRILFFHGGGFTTGSTKDHLDLCGKLSSSSGACVFSVDYKLAPEHKFPAPHEDCLTSYLWLLKQGIEPSKIIIAGISAGGTLALSTLLSLRDNGVELPAAAVCMSPLVDMLFQGHSMVTNRGKDWMTHKRLENIKKVYLKGHDLMQPLASPLYADLYGLPPIMIQAGSHELLLDDIIRFHKKAVDSDVEVTFELWKDMFHSFQIFSSCVEEGQNAIYSAGEYIKNILSIDQ
jgi:monoterpene epsilon-lactone hydrolase